MISASSSLTSFSSSSEREEENVKKGVVIDDQQEEELDQEEEIDENDSNNNNNEEEVFEIRDYSVATHFEKYIDEIEQVLNQWFTTNVDNNTTIDNDKVDNNTKKFIKKKQTLQQSKFTLIYYKFPKKEEEPFPFRVHHLQRWFHLNEFFILKKFKKNENITKDQISTIFSIFTIAITNFFNLQKSLQKSLQKNTLENNLEKNINFFILLNKKNKTYLGKSLFTNYITKYSSEVQLINNKNNNSKLGINDYLELFILQISKYINQHLNISINSRFTFIIDSFTQIEWYKLLQNSLQKSLQKSLQFSKNGNLNKNLLIGTIMDPIQEIHFSYQYFNSISGNSTFNHSIFSNHLFKNLKTIEFRKIKIENKYLNTYLGNIINHFLFNIYYKCYNNYNLYKNRNEITKNEKKESLEYIHEMLFELFDSDISINDISINEDINDIIIKGCIKNSLLNRFCNYLFKIKNENHFLYFWKLFIRVIFKYWEESNIPNLINDDITINDEDISKKEFTTFIPYSPKKVNLKTCLIEQKLTLLNNCCCNQLNKNYKKLEILKTIKNINIPVTQELPFLTEDLLFEKEMVLINMDNSINRMKLQSEQIRRDMEVFKYVNRNNPNLEFNDFLLWYSPKDIIDNKDTTTIENKDTTTMDDNKDTTTIDNTIDDNIKDKNTISKRMLKENIWQQCWKETKPISINEQPSIFDYNKEGEKIIHYLENINLNELMNQLLYCFYLTIYYKLFDFYFYNNYLKNNIYLKHLFNELNNLFKLYFINNVNDINGSDNINSNINGYNSEIKVPTNEQLRELKDMIQLIELNISMILSLQNKLNDNVNNDSDNDSDKNEEKEKIIKEHDEINLLNEMMNIGDEPLIIKLNTENNEQQDDNNMNENNELIKFFKEYLEKKKEFTPNAKEYLFKTFISRPYPNINDNKKNNLKQMMYILLNSEKENRICMTLSEDQLF